VGRKKLGNSFGEIDISPSEIHKSAREIPISLEGIGKWKREIGISLGDLPISFRESCGQRRRLTKL